MPEEYAHALAQSIEHSDDKEACVDGLIQVLRRHGKMKALPAIAKAYERIIEHKDCETVLTVARESDTQYATRSLQKRFTVTSQPTIEVQTSLIGGWRYEDANTLIDTSHKAALLKLYRRITKEALV